MEIQVSAVSEKEMEAVADLLNQAKLPFQDIHEHRKTFLAAKLDGKVIGAIGLELWGSSALLRSFIVHNEFRGSGIGKMLYDACIHLARKHNVQEIGLLTTTAEGYFLKQGFAVIPKDKIPDFIKSTKEFTTYCSSSSTVMLKHLN
jgi:N-acetylglutamate synthase-like GNAT family acetyltransferase